MTDSPTPQRILAVHRYYWPDTAPYASLLRRIVAHWSQEGHHVEVLSSQPSYKKDIALENRPFQEQIDGVHVRRLALPNEAGRPFIRLLNALRLCLSVFLRILIGRYDIVMISSIPPVLGGVTVATAARLTGTRFIYHCMDIHPEVGRVSGEFSNPTLFRILQTLDTWTCNQANPAIVLSSDMEQALYNRPGGESIQVQVLNNFSLPSPTTLPDTLPFQLSSKGFTVLFAGNIGRFQGLDTAVAAMGELQHRPDIELLMMGDGVAKARLIQQAQTLKANVRFVKHYPIEVAKATMRLAGAGFVSLRPGLYQYVYPSKTMTYLEQGCPLLVAIEPESKLAIAVCKENLGLSVPNGDVQALAKAIVQLADTGDQRAIMRSSALKKAQTEGSEAIILQKWSQLLLQNERRDHV
ncbi:hypothetical protein C1752_03204 [Acaryochloris thomasi RCC1774]|uniref:Glycosyltransferase subfamily 4-like N-terminal domain-containing protein n=1 Tax=Acaryochloris thomasi RCC1774 TaxID=1764569 RepID=A0A2W1JWI4_9CYAN|nr:glycosyltransferase family 4 protein [Acaryochloris thomasi]PZD72757.1 hypothetical protein C1752_03204 [Acaryochloris thomasi RCC1774]